MIKVSLDTWKNLLSQYIFQNIIAYKTCYEEEQKKCTSTPLLRQNGVSHEECKDLCDQDEDCKFTFWNPGSFCSLHETCDDFKTTRGIGTLSAKESCPGAMLLFYEYDYHSF